MPADSFSARDLDVAKELGVMNGRLTIIEGLLQETRTDMKQHLLQTGNGKTANKALDVTLKTLMILGAVLAGWMGSRL
jgi:hypothetical protein